MRYPGGKNAGGTWQWIAGLMPLHARYAEPFAGSFALGRHKSPALRSVAIDRDADVCRWLRRLAMPGVEVRCGNGITWLEQNAAELVGDWLVYCDPPYILSARTKRKIYKHELSDRDHGRLLSAVTSLRCAVMVSGYDSSLYRKTLKSWARHTRRVITRGGTWRTEVLWLNFDPPRGGTAGQGDAARLLSIVGRDFRERERIKRLVKRWRHNLMRRPAGERRAILAALVAAEASIQHPHPGPLSRGE
jgi:DNA adenine methylase